MTDFERQAAAPAAPTIDGQAGPTIADPAPLGLAAFALTMFLFSIKNAGWTRGTEPWLAFAFAYGGLVQLLAGMWEFRRGSVFWTTAFGTYGAFWLGLGLYLLLVPPGASPAQVSNDLGWTLLAFTIFNTYMLLWSTQINEAILAVFLTLEVTLILLLIGNFAQSTGMIKAGGYVGIITAICAWYASAAGVVNGMLGRALLVVGGPVMKPPAMKRATAPTPHPH